MIPAVELWIATGNPNKAEELGRLLPPAVKLHRLDELDGGDGFAVAEDEADFAANARKKAAAAAGFVAARGAGRGALVVADDSGLSVDALGGRPGVRSSRYAGPGATDAERVDKLLAELDGVPPERRTARFTCALVVLHADGLPFFSTECTAEGKILPAPAGESGFGYDPVFVPDAAPAGREGRSFASLTPAEKDAVSHRGKALRELARRLEALLAR